MTNYQLEEFKAWLEEKPERKGDVVWSFIFPVVDTDELLEQLIERKSFFAQDNWQSASQIAQKWKAQTQNQHNRILELEQNLTNKDLQQENWTLKEQLQDSQQRILALEADKQDLIHQLTQAQEKHQEHLSQEKSLIAQEIQLIKEVIYE